MLADFDKTLEKLLITEGNLNRSEIDIAFDPPTGEWSSRLNRPTLNCWCFDLRENIKLRIPDRTVANNGNAARIGMPIKRMDLSYLVTAWARKMEDEHQLLWRGLGALKRFSALEPDQCEGALQYQEHNVPLAVADMSLIQTNLVDLWSVLENQMRLGFVLVATVELDIRFGFDVPLVLEGTIRVGEADRPEKRTLTGRPEEIKIKPRSNKKDVD
jgi:Pvc16 N-terminal domain